MKKRKRQIGRGTGKWKHVKSLEKVHKWCNDYHVAFKLNTVVNSLNTDEDMNQNIFTLNPVRWKVQSLFFKHLKIFSLIINFFVILIVI